MSRKSLQVGQAHVVASSKSQHSCEDSCAEQAAGTIEHQTKDTQANQRSHDQWRVKEGYYVTRPPLWNRLGGRRVPIAGGETTKRNVINIMVYTVYVPSCRTVGI